MANPAEPANQDQTDKGQTASDTTLNDGQRPAAERSGPECLIDQSQPDLVVITGMSGAGRTEAMHTFEDLGYFCIDNLPPSLLMNLVALADLVNQPKRRLAVVCDIRAEEFFDELETELERIRHAGVLCSVLFLDCSDKVLLARYKASRRRHPLDADGLETAGAINAERQMLAKVQSFAEHKIMTSSMRPIALRRAIRQIYSTQSEQENMAVSVVSFGFKHGLPTEADLVIDVRFLPNPYYDEGLRVKTGLDPAVIDYVLGQAETKDFIRVWQDLLQVVMPGYVSEGKPSLLIAIGCTGGQHRSVVLAEQTAGFLKQAGYCVSISHRDISLAELV